MREVAVTGIGLVSPLGIGTEASWHGLVEGLSAVRELPSLAASHLSCHLGADVRGFDPSAFISNRRNLRLMSDGDRFAFAAASIALEDAGLERGAVEPDRTALYVGGDKEVCVGELVEAPFLAARLPDGGVDEARWVAAAQNELYPLFYLNALPGAILFYLSEAFGITGSNGYFAGTSDAGLTAVGTGYRAIRRGECDVALVGGFSDAALWWTSSKVDGLELLTTRNELGAAAFRPYHVDRDGAVLGEGAAFLVLEEAQQANHRGARIYATVSGFGAGLDATAILTPEPAGRALAGAIRRALSEAGLEPAAVGAIVAHGSATRLGDSSETAALREVFGRGRQPLATAIKPATGHMIAGGGALNCAVAALSLYEQRLPPTLNLDKVDPACSFNWLTGSAADVRAGAAVAVARGIEGQAVALSMRSAA